jgi:transcriptional regulator with PAS, ATPase and Fis domain
MIQTKLLRVLQEKQIKPLGDTKAVDIDVRIIASTNRDLERKIKTEEFREDLFYRLNVLTIHLPPLRERPTDIPLLARHLVAAHSQKLGKPEKMISDRLMDILVKHSWPGNVRELENILVQGIVYAESDTITCSDVPVDDLDTGKAVRTDTDFSRLNTLPYREAKEELLRQFNHQYVGAMLAITNGNITRAAKKSGLERQALQQIIKRFDIDPEQYRG